MCSFVSYLSPHRFGGFLQGGSTCLLEAISAGHYYVVEILLRSGADISGADQVSLSLCFVIMQATDLTTSCSIISEIICPQLKVSVSENIRKLLEKTKQVWCTDPWNCLSSNWQNFNYVQRSVCWRQGMGSMRKAPWKHSSISTSWTHLSQEGPHPTPLWSEQWMKYINVLYSSCKWLN